MEKEDLDLINRSFSGKSYLPDLNKTFQAPLWLLFRNLIVVVFILFLMATPLIYSYYNSSLNYIEPNRGGIVSNPQYEIDDLSKFIDLPAPSFEEGEIRGLLDIDLEAEAYIAFNPYTEAIYVAKNQNREIEIASITKLMTAVVAVDYYENSDLLIMPAVGDDEYPSSLGLEEGDQMDFKTAYQTLLVSSRNDVAELIAANYAGGRTKFIDSMNLRADALGMNETQFTNPSGLDEEDGFITGVSTINDLILLLNHILMYPEITEAVGQLTVTGSYLKRETGNEEEFAYYNTNKLLDDYVTIEGFKTGYTSKAGECLIAYFNTSEGPVFTIVMNADDRFEVTETLVEELNETYYLNIY